jgi:hypothetical protein
MQKRLEDRGFIIDTIGNTLERPQAESGIYIIDTKAPQDVITGLEQELHLPTKESTLPPGVFIASSTKILIILGENMEE